MNSQEPERWVVFEDAWEAHGFTQLPNAVMRDPDLSLAAKSIYGLLKSYAWEDPTAHPGLERLCRNAAVSDKTLAKWMKELKAAGLIEVKQRGQGKTNLYTFRSLRHRYGPEVNQPLHPEVKASLHQLTYAESDTGPSLESDTGPNKEDSVKNTQKLSSKEDSSLKNQKKKIRKKRGAQALMVETVERLKKHKIKMSTNHRNGHLSSWNSILKLDLPESEIDATLEKLVEQWLKGNTIPPSEAHSYVAPKVRAESSAGGDPEYNSWASLNSRDVTAERLAREAQQRSLDENAD